MPDPTEALKTLAMQLRGEESVISPHVGDPGAATPALGMLVAAGPRAAEAPDEYAVLIESIREGYLLHYSVPRLVSDTDDDLALLAGDYLYARGLERLAGLGDLEAVRELSDLISLAAQLHAANHASPGVAERSDALWLAATMTVAAGPGPGHGDAKAALRSAEPGAAQALWTSAHQVAAAAGLGGDLERAAETIGFRPG
ncbi:MAG: hypothetical protein ACXWWL_04970 [Candidatus Limnocylindria bacterium]